ncbi:hypothetical protein D3C85_1537760 [compost metagenome]
MQPAAISFQQRLEEDHPIAQTRRAALAHRGTQQDDGHPEVLGARQQRLALALGLGPVDRGRRLDEVTVLHGRGRGDGGLEHDEGRIVFQVITTG